ncbi:hypothetical protein ACFQGT_13095 [Natrialbaceae archaeon GCM10025810]|uniref:hypothetical protein n=1 Tax=Halovalidus salilacus TaxID=3075124 RepID=UPI00360BAA33
MNVDIVDDLRQPEYTGENRCLPCAVVNLVIAALLSSVVARKSRLGGAIALGVSIALIYLRGYLVPGTPTLTKRYLPPEVLRWFGKDPEADLEVASGLGGPTGVAVAGDESVDDDGTAAAADATVAADGSEDTVEDGDATETDPSATVDLEEYFLAHEVLEPCADEDDLCLTDSFEAAWFEEIEPLASESVEEIDPAEIAAAFGLEDVPGSEDGDSGADVSDEGDTESDAGKPHGVELDEATYELESTGEAYVLRADSRRVGHWPSRAALVADVAASRVLEAWVPDWNEYEPHVKGTILNSLRMFLETCPTGGEIRMGEETVESCCTSHTVVAVTCEETGERLFEQRVDTIDADA